MGGLHAMLWEFLLGGVFMFVGGVYGICGVRGKVRSKS